MNGSPALIVRLMGRDRRRRGAVRMDDGRSLAHRAQPEKLSRVERETGG